MQIEGGEKKQQAGVVLATRLKTPGNEIHHMQGKELGCLQF